MRPLRARAIHQILIFALFASVAVAHAEDDSDGPVPVVVKPKRSSIHGRGLPRLIEISEERSPNIQKAEADLNVAKLQFSIASRQWLPTLDLQVQNGHGVTNAAAALPSQWAQYLNLSLTENLYDNGKALNGFEIAKNVYERAKIEFEVARDTQLLNLTNAYYDWSASIETREILENKRDLLRRQHSVLETLYKQGIKTKRDVLRIQTEVRKNDLDVVNADNDLDLNFQKLASFVGVTRGELEKEEIEPEEAKPFVKSESEPAMIRAEDHRQAKIYAFQRKEAELQTRLVQRDYWPQISVNGTFGYQNLYYLYHDNPSPWDSGRSWIWTGMVTLTYNLWDWGIRRKNLEVAHIKEKKVIDTNEQALLDLSNDLRDVSNKLRSFRENVKMTRELLVLEQQSYSILEAEYRNGRAQYLDLITNLNSLIDARSKFIASYYGLKKQQALYSFHEGDLYEALKQK